MGTKSLIFPFALEVHPGSQEYGQHHPPAQTVQPLPVSDCPDQLEVCGRSAEGMPQQGELWTLLNVYFKTKTLNVYGKTLARSINKYVRLSKICMLYFEKIARRQN